MARKVGRKNLVKADFSMYDYMLLGSGGIGKTTIVNEIGTKLYGDEGVLLLEIGRENGVSHLDAFYEQVDTFDDLEEIIDVLIKERTTTFKDTKIIAIDSVDELVRLAEAKTIEIYNDSVDVNKQVSSISACFGGFNKGVTFAVDLLVSTVFKLKDVGYSLFFISHIKEKTLVDPVTQIEYPQVTCNVNKNYFNAIKDKVHVVAVGYVEREYDNLMTEDRKVKGFDGKTRNEKIGVSNGILNEKRVIVFRDDNYVLDAKSRFANIEPKIDFDSDEFIRAVNEAIKSQISKQNRREVTDAEMKQVADKQQEEQMKKVETVLQNKVAEEQKQNDEQKKERILQQLVGGYKTMSKEKKLHIKQVLTDNGATKLQELSVEVLKTLL